MEYDWRTLFSQSNLNQLFKGLQQAIAGLTQMKQPWISIALLVALLFGTQFLANFVMTPFGIGVMLGAVGVMYLLANSAATPKTDTQRS